MTRIGRRAGAALVAATLLTAVACSTPKHTGTGSSGASESSQSSKTSGSARGFDGKTITVAGIGTLAQFADAEIGAEARFKRFNDTNEIPGIRINFARMADDNGDPATALTEVRRLVTQDRVFAIVPNLSAVNPGSYLKGQHVPSVGEGFDATYCSNAASTSVWAFGFNGCLVPDHPLVIPDLYGDLYRYASDKTSKKHPTLVLFSGDTQSGKNAARFQASAAQGAGFKVVSAKGELPAVTSDYTPYVQQWLRADDGKPPDVVACAATTQCIPTYAALKNEAYTGTFFSPLGAVDAVAKPMAGSLTFAYYNVDPNAGLQQLEADLQAFKPGTKPVSYGNVPAYFAADMFIQALKKVGKNITPDSVQKALATQTWQIKGLVGPLKYPASTATPTPYCFNLLQAKSDGSGYSTLQPYGCSSRTFKIDPRFSG
jgi:branched-chain amino acid transport system substrate-binding protein